MWTIFIEIAQCVRLKTYFLLLLKTFAYATYILCKQLFAVSLNRMQRPHRASLQHYGS